MLESPADELFRFYDTHLHVAEASDAGFDKLLAHIAATPGMVGANLIANTPEELALVERRWSELPESFTLVPFFDPEFNHSQRALASGWFKIHPIQMRISREGVDLFVEQVARFTPAVKGLVVHAFPWGTKLQYETSLPLVLRLAERLPETPVLITHGGGYESWIYRAHAFSLPNIYVDYSVTLAYYRGSDLLRPLGDLARRKPKKLLFGTDWPWADVESQVTEAVRVAAEAGVGRNELQEMMLDNARRLWPLRT